jgi:O-antigen ligase
LLGSGYETYPENIENGHFHNMFIEVIVTTGLAGLLPFVGFILGGLSRVLVASRATGEDAERSLASLDLLVISIALIVANMTGAGASHYSWDLLGFCTVAVSARSVLANARPSHAQGTSSLRFGNILK